VLDRGRRGGGCSRAVRVRRKTGFQLVATQVLGVAEVATLYGLRLRPVDHRRVEMALGALANEIEVAVQAGRMAPEQAERLILYPELDRIRGIKGEESVTLKALVARMPNWFADDMLVCDAMRRDRAWNGIGIEPAVAAFDPEPVAVGRSFKDGVADCRRRARSSGLSWAPPPMQTVIGALVAHRELRMTWPAAATGRTESWSRIITPKARVVASWSEDRIDLGHAPDADEPPDMGTFAAIRIPVAGAGA